LDLPGLLKSHGLRPDKRLGQNFLMDDAILAKIVAAAEVEPDDTVVEIGAGLGSLTRHLAIAARRVVAVEIDRDLIPLLREVVAPYPNVEIDAGDILALEPTRLAHQTPGYLVVANIPYYITSAVIRHLLEAPQQPRRLVLTMQKEVAQRINAQPGDLSLLALSVQVYGTPKIVGQIPAGAFFPAPQVDSSVIRVDLYAEPAVPREDLGRFFRLIKAGFSQKRKTLRNALSAGLRMRPDQVETGLRVSGIDPQRRAETLSLDEWGKVVEVFGAIEDQG
jgi:16S rRNA (adenine1518-N6/adenine1519-N6)-dimethyltransferase